MKNLRLKEKRKKNSQKRLLNRQEPYFLRIAMKFLAWFSCGVTSAVACKLAIDKYGDDVDIWYLETGAVIRTTNDLLKTAKTGMAGKF